MAEELSRPFCDDLGRDRSAEHSCRAGTVARLRVAVTAVLDTTDRDFPLDLARDLVAGDLPVGKPTGPTAPAILWDLVVDPYRWEFVIAASPMTSGSGLLSPSGLRVFSVQEFPRPLLRCPSFYGFVAVVGVRGPLWLRVCKSDLGQCRDLV
ncbi:MAG: hypothetical protein ACYDHP_11645 [Ferrimicrobium sp.]